MWSFSVSEALLAGLQDVEFLCFRGPSYRAARCGVLVFQRPFLQGCQMWSSSVSETLLAGLYDVALMCFRGPSCRAAICGVLVFQ